MATTNDANDDYHEHTPVFTKLEDNLVQENWVKVNQGLGGNGEQQDEGFEVHAVRFTELENEEERDEDFCPANSATEM